MHVDWQLASLSLGSCFLAGLLLRWIMKWRVWVAALVVGIVATVLGAIVRPMVIELGTMIVAFGVALAGAALGSVIQRKRIA